MGPDIRWNAAGSFIGTVNEEDATLEFNTFLAAPFLDTSTLYVERKFSGSTTAGRSKDIVGSAIDAYAHHVLLDSNGELLLTDLQGKSFGSLCIALLISDALCVGVVGIVSKSVILFDPQAQSCVTPHLTLRNFLISVYRLAKETGFWDGGLPEITAWEKAHKCNDFCIKLKLNGNKTSRQAPLRIGFSQTR